MLAESLSDTDEQTGPAAMRTPSFQPDLPETLCRHAETLFHCGRYDEALTYAAAAYAEAPDERATLQFCSWLFSNCHRHGEAADVYRRLLSLMPDWIEGYRHASGSLAASGDPSAAAFYAARASDLAPGNVEYAIHAGETLLLLDKVEQARIYFMRAAAATPDDARTLCRLSATALALGNVEEGLCWALRAYDSGPDRATAMHAIELLMRAERFAEAVTLAEDTVEAYPDDPRLLRILSSARMLCGHWDEALEAVDRALALQPDAAEFHHHRGSLLQTRGELRAAGDAFGRAADMDAGNVAARRSQLSVLCESGELTGASTAAGALLMTVPESHDDARSVFAVLERRLSQPDDGSTGPFVFRGQRDGHLPRQRASRWNAFCTQFRVIGALTIRETRTRFGDSRLGYGWAVIEPVVHIVILSVIFSAMMHGRPPIGDHFFVFYYTGLLPFYVFLHTSSSMTHAISTNGSLLQLPVVTTFDVIVARGILELITDVVVAVVLFCGFNAVGIDAVPHDLWGASIAILTIGLLGCGCGFLNAVVNAFLKSWDKVWAQLTRTLYFCSGIFYMPAMMPRPIRQILAWNPVLQAVDWFRTSFFAEYQPHWLDRAYLAVVTLGTALAGIALERALRRRLLAAP